MKASRREICWLNGKSARTRIDALGFNHGVSVKEYAHALVRQLRQGRRLVDFDVDLPEIIAVKIPAAMSVEQPVVCDHRPERRQTRRRQFACSDLLKDLEGF